MKDSAKMPRHGARSREDGVGHARVGTATGRAADEKGAILILALAYLVAVSLVVALLSTWATGALNNSSNFTSANSQTLAATDMTNLSIQYVRYHPLISSSQPPEHASPTIACWGSNSTTTIPVIDGDQVAVWCSTVWDPISDLTRDVTFDACPVAVLVAQCVGNNVLLTAEVRFDDYPPLPAHSAPIQDLCSLWCGSGMEVVKWQWGSSSPNAVAGKATTLQFSTDPSPTTAGGTTTAEVTVDDANGTPVPGDTVAITEASGPTQGITSAKSTLIAVTNSSGVAQFTNIEPQTATTTITGPYVLTAVDETVVGALVQGNSTPFKVNPTRSMINVTSTAPTNATVGVGSYLPSATATSPDTVTITLDTSSTGCALNTRNGIVTVTFTAAGTCVVDFNDLATGNPNLSPAFQVQQSFPVGGQVATKVAMTLGSTTPAASGTTNTSITMVLKNGSGATVSSSGTTTVVLSDIGRGTFALTNGATGATSVNVNFPNGATTETAYFGNENVGPDTITAVSGIANFGSASLTVQGGAASQVVITPGTLSPAVSSVTNTSLSFQLEDAYGNLATSTGTTTLALSDSGNGFFASANAAAGTSTLNITFAPGVGTATAYFGNEASGTDLVTAKNGAASWGSTTLSLVAGAATTAQITLSTTTPAKSNSTNTTVSVQLLDQYGNHVTTSSVALTLSNSGSGFFATRQGVSVNGGATSTLALTTNAGGVATAYFGDSVAQSDTVTVSGSGITATTPPFLV